MDNDTVLDVSNLSIHYKTRQAMVPAVRDVSFHIKRGETLGIVGESGCGKSTVAFGIVDFLGINGRITGGKVFFEGENLVGRSRRELNRLRGDRVTMVYQDPMAALNPSVTISDQMAEALVFHRNMSWADAQQNCVEMLKKVHMPDPGDVMNRYPHQISGGQQQRVVIAMAMLNNPSLLIMDEPTTALDVTVEAAVLDLVEELKNEFNTGILFISHNLGVVARVSDKLCVMYAGQVVEQGPVGEIFRQPAHPYTKGLLKCVPRLGTDKLSATLEPIPGRVPAPLKRPLDACVFAPRCPYKQDDCLEAWPQLRDMDDDHLARCFYAQDVMERRAQTTKRREIETNGTEPTGDKSPLLILEDLKIYYEQESQSIKSLFGLAEPQMVKAVDDISLSVAKGRTLGIVGESGCGKSTLVKGVIGLEQISGGGMNYLSLDINQPVSQRGESVIKEIQMVFQNPDATLNPSYTVGQQIARPIKKFTDVKKRSDVRAEVIRLLKSVRLGAAYYDRYPRQLSGGEKQRVGIARALASRPDMVICDEPVSALDVSVQAAVLNLLLEIQEVFGTTLIFIAHDLSVVRFFSDEVAVMYLGQIMEIGPAETIYAPPYHPYTEALLSAVPIPDPEAEQQGIRLSGNVPSALNPPSGCRFHTRCPRRVLLPEGGAICEKETPPFREASPGHRILCHIPIDQLKQLEPPIRLAG
jgi:peptide/nickel transport system ATP-binding protein